jgi:putative intracellular protease/amidase
MMNVSVLLFDGFETLDVFGPVEIFGRIKDRFRVNFYSLTGDMVRNEHGILMAAERLEKLTSGTDIFLIPGGPGTRREIDNVVLIDAIKATCDVSKFVLTVCTGSALLAKTGLLDGRNATSNKKAFEWVKSSRHAVRWVREARWCVDDKYYTSSGVSAGMDMTFGFLSDLYGAEFSRKVAYEMEYVWHENKNEDHFHKQ